MKVRLINPPCVDKARENNDHEYDFRNLPHLGLGYIGSLLEHNGFEVDMLECTERGMSVANLSAVLLEGGYDAIGISTYTYNFANVIRIIRTIKKLNPIPFVFLGGFTPTLDHDSILPLVDGIGCCIRGEGEYTCLELMEALRDKKDWHNIPGVAYREENIVRIAPNRQFIEDLDKLPIPKRAFISKIGIVTMITSRGCYGECTFCELKGFQKTCTGKPVRWRSAENVVNEIEFLIKEYNIKCIYITDDNFLISSPNRKEWLAKFHELMRSKGLTVELNVAARANDMISNCEIIKKLKEVGLTRVFMGIESFVQRQLDYYNKKTTVEQNLRALEIAHELDIKISIGFLIFEPFVTIKEIRENIKILKSTKFCDWAEEDFNPVSLRVPVILFPGTKIREQMVNLGLYVAGEECGYVFQDEDVVLLRKVMTEWAKILRPVHLMDYLVYKAIESENSALAEKLMMERSKMLNLDLSFIEEACDGIENKTISFENFHYIDSKWKSALNRINVEFTIARTILCL
jgi:anaerobic magnesium-protoporphyrin IX monomethyl ester cyclase